jgi:hypothetical protein
MPIYAASEADLPELSTETVQVTGIVAVTNASLNKDGQAASYNAHSIKNNKKQWNISGMQFEALLANIGVEHDEPLGYVGVYKVTGLATTKYVTDNKAPKGQHGEQAYGIINVLSPTDVQLASGELAAPVDMDEVGVENARGGQVLSGNYEGARYASGNTGTKTASGATAVQFRARRKPQPETVAA